MQQTPELEAPEKELDVRIVRDEKGEERVKVFEKDLVNQLGREPTPDEKMKKFILYSKIAAGVSLASLVIALAIVGINLTADAVSWEANKTGNLLSLFLFVAGIVTFFLALLFEKKSKKPRIKEKPKISRRVRKNKSRNLRKKRR